MSLQLQLPLPPTSNHLYIPVNGRLIKSNDGRKYDQQIDLLKLKYCRQLDQFKASYEPETKLKVNVTVYFTEKRFYTKKGTLRKIDSFNRLKQIYDSVAKLINVDDSYFIESTVIKTFHNKDFDMVIVDIMRL